MTTDTGQKPGSTTFYSLPKALRSSAAEEFYQLSDRSPDLSQSDSSASSSLKGSTNVSPAGGSDVLVNLTEGLHRLTLNDSQLLSASWVQGSIGASKEHASVTLPLTLTIPKLTFGSSESLTASSDTSPSAVSATTLIVTSTTATTKMSTSSSSQSGGTVHYRPQIPDSFVPKYFSGLTSDNAESWLESFSSYVGAKGFSVEEQLRFFPLLLREGASEWYKTLTDAVRGNIDRLANAFNERYAKTTLEKTFDRDSVFSRVQKQDERVHDYITIMQRLAVRIQGDDPLPNEMLRGLIMRGLRPHIRRHVVQQDPKTIDALLTAARAAELAEEVSSEKDDDRLQTLVTEVRNLGKQLATRDTMVPIDRRSPTPERRQVRFQDAETAAPRSPAGGAWRGRGFSRGNRGYANNQRQNGAGSSNVCGRCASNVCPGKDNDQQCFAIRQGLQCFGCGRRNHISRACRSGRRNFGRGRGVMQGQNSQ